MSAHPIRFERRGRVGFITLDRPERLNAIDTATVAALDAILGTVEADRDLGALVIAGEGRVFSAGADITELSALANSGEFSEFVHRLTDVYDRLQRCRLPSVAALHGVVFGGGFELALACDLRVAEAGTRLGVPEIKLGLLPAGGGTARLTRMVPPAIAKQLLMTGEPIAVDDALRFGLINQVVPSGGASEVATSVATALAALPSAALAAAKRLVDAGASMPLGPAVLLERETVSMLFGLDDRTEGIAAFLQKRPARFNSFETVTL